MPEDARGLRVWLWAPLTGLVTAGLALALLLAWPPSQPDDPAGRMPDFLAQDGGTQPPPVAVHCLRPGGPGPLPQADGTCRVGDLLSIKAATRRGEHYLSAASLGPDGAVRWYFPSAGVASLVVGPGGLASRGALVGSDHPAGRHALFVLLSAAPLAEAEARLALEQVRAGWQPGPRVLEAEFEVLR
ncbi:MAG TPA: hypothetical protein PK668_18155 [Myxococcota bacterium]|nr:hypothetical protein [Myxococcota bacterium]HRY95887.1 hypothetical protein [Myxococcota bacterium]